MTDRKSGEPFGNGSNHAGSSPDGGLDVEAVRADFPILALKVRGKPLVYLDNAATTQKPSAVINAISRYYETENANVHRGVHYLSEVATEAFETSRRTIQRYVNARSSREIVFVRGATEGINLVAQTFGRMRVKAGDEVIVSAMEHHSNIVPWQILCEQAGASLKVIPMNQKGELLIDELPRLIGPRTRMLGLVHVSNALGTVNPVEEIIQTAHAAGVPVLIDAAQSLQHLEVDVQAWDVDFLVASGHKMYGPTGIGFVYGKEAHLEAMPPYQGGGDMIASVSFERTTYNELPHKFEAGTPHVAGVIGLGKALDYLSGLGIGRIREYEGRLLAYAQEALSALPEIRIVGTASHKASVVSFLVEGIHPHDLGTILDQEAVAIRTGHHCAQPVMDFYGIPATARASIAFYNTRKEIDLLVQGLSRAFEVFGR